ncbi:MAG: hypothetical protein IJ087_11135, partial [Eggerthellaceae bacterium]|nr:hypothetical protein [Eggerthellaceae bacterium]
MATWTRIWQQAITRSFGDGRAFGWNKTAAFALRAPAGGSKVRVRFSNVLGECPYDIGSAVLAYRGVDIPVTLGGATRFSIATGGKAYSDAVDLPIAANERLEVRIFYTSPV